uniref:Uncharacterized protein n=1 Tax=Globisporangium ultimum (strain ATCC 200006 / CBS 805.95 / DAOM BR144) TaxID=431595 RepID=K3WZU1_GLOUD
MIATSEGCLLSLSPQVQAIASCVTNAGDKSHVAMLVSSRDDTNFEFVDVCAKRANSSMLAVNLAKRREGEEWASDELKRTRTVHSFTIGRLSRELEDLAATFDAKCGDSVHDYQGLHYNLRSRSTSIEHLLAGKEALNPSSF